MLKTLIMCLLIINTLQIIAANKVVTVNKITDFENIGTTLEEEWWKFGNIKIQKEKNPYNQNYSQFIKKNSLKISGETKEFYAGGIGKYLGIDGTQYNNIKLLIKGNGKNSGVLVMELYDDDNNSWIVETNKNANNQPSEDDKFIYSIPINWYGWKTVIIKLKDFKDDNLGVGDDTWNPNQKNDSGGLLQIQFILLTQKEKSKININIDNIKVFKLNPNK